MSKKRAAFKRPPVTRFRVPTYHVNKDFDNPMVTVGVSKYEGLLIELGPRGKDGCDGQNIQVERRPNGWMIALNPVGGGDSSGHVYFLDDGRSFIVKGCYEFGRECESNIKMVEDCPKEVDELKEVTA